MEKLDNQEFKGSTVRCTADVCITVASLCHKIDQVRLQTQDEVPRDRYRSRSPHRRGGNYGGPPDDYYGRRGPPARGYSPRREDYRHRSPPGRRGDDYYSRDRYRSPPRGVRGPPVEDYPPARSYRGDPYAAPPPRRYDDEPYANGGYDRAPRARTPPPRAYGGGYEERPRYWY